MTNPVETPCPELWQGIHQFNQGEFYACHDTLEAIWMTASMPEKPFFQGILQLAVALYHLSNRNWQGAAILLGEGMRRLEQFEPDYYDVNVTNLLDIADPWLATLQKLGPDQVDQMAQALHLTSQGQPSPQAVDSLPMWQICRVDATASADGMP